MFIDSSISYENAINILLVYHECREVALIESANWNISDVNKRLEHINYIHKKLLRPLSLICIYDELSILQFPRWFIVKKCNSHLIKKNMTHSDVGRILGMRYYNDPNFNNFNVDRYCGSIYINEFNVYTELVSCTADNFNPQEFNTFIIDKVNKWNGILKIKSSGFKCSGEVKRIFGIETLKKYMFDSNFTTDYINDYKNMVSNWISTTNMNDIDVLHAFNKLIDDKII